MGFLHNQNNKIEITKYKLASALLAEEFSGFRLVHLSDLHGKSFGADQRELIGAVRTLAPDAIAFTGDLIDGTRYGGEEALLAMRGLTSIAPVYYVNGNHEWRSGKFPALERQLLDAGVRVLRNAREAIRRGERTLWMLGIDDPFARGKGRVDADVADEEIRIAAQGLDLTKEFAVLLSHRPELLTVYARNRIPLTLSGHAHGGQFRLPLVGGLFAPHQGLFPKFAEGMHRKDSAALIVSRGLGNSSFPQRLFNRPEVILIELHAGRAAI